MTNVLRIDQWFSKTVKDTTEHEDPIKTMKTTNPSPNSKPLSVNVLRIVYEHAGSELDDIDAEILDHQRKINELEAKKKYITQLKALADEFYNLSISEKLKK